jgi:hypothetical protein
MLFELAKSRLRPLPTEITEKWQKIAHVCAHSLESKSSFCSQRKKSFAHIGKNTARKVMVRLPKVL